MPKNDKLLNKKIRCVDAILLRCINMDCSTSIFSEYVTGQQRQNLLKNKQLVVLYTGSFKAHNLQGNLNYKKYTACHTVCHFTYTALTLTLSPPAKN